MVVVSDTSPITNLAIIGHLSLLQKQFQEIWVPVAVQVELRALQDSVALAMIDAALQKRWIKPRIVAPNPIVRFLTSELDRGEAEAIALGIELAANVVLLDEREG